MNKQDPSSLRASYPSSDFGRPRTTHERPKGSKVIGVRIRYVDGSVHDLQPGVSAWDATPSSGVVFVAVFHDATYQQDGRTLHYRTPLHSQEYYWWFKGEYGSGPFPAGAHVKHGRAIGDAAWRELYDEAIEERAWP